MFSWFWSVFQNDGSLHMHHSLHYYAIVLQAPLRILPVRRVRASDSKTEKNGEKMKPVERTDVCQTSKTSRK